MQYPHVIHTKMHIFVGFIFLMFHSIHILVSDEISHYPLVSIHIDPENHPFEVETHLPTPIWRLNSYIFTSFGRLRSSRNPPIRGQIRRPIGYMRTPCHWSHGWVGIITKWPQISGEIC